MSDVTVGQITSTPDSDGNHRLKCPKCHAEFLAHITSNDDTQQANNTVCEACGYSGKPVEFLYQANKEVADKMVGDYAMNELKKAFGGNKHINIKL
ncbi:hypothetical protein JNM87_00955 [Candidatus Saccharibacteria bacterium]|nr:hypothetical protein [Candidatus Saccharibacteria bacterium]